MKREDVAKAAEKIRLKILGVQTHPVLEQPYRDMEQVIANEIIEQVNSALDSVAIEGIDAILEDFTDRRGLRQEWEEIDEKIQQEILDEWRNIIRTYKIK